MHYRLMYPSDYLNAADLHGKDVTVTINFVAVEDVPDPQGKKKITKKALSMLTPRSIAYWFMDDGGLGKSKNRKGSISYSLYLNTYVSEEEHHLIISYFKTHYGIEFRLNRNHNLYRLRIGKKAAKKFIKIIKPFLLEEFLYKINLSK